MDFSFGQLAGQTRFLKQALLMLVWSSTLLFGLFILCFYIAAALTSNWQDWNEFLPGVYQVGATEATAAMAIHFIFGAVILLLGCFQFLPAIRQRWLAVHKAAGVVYIIACAFTAVGGLVFIALQGTVGGTVMNVGFSLYGLLMLIAAGATPYYAIKRNLTLHKLWAMRLFSLALASWLYRMEYGFWFLLTDNLGHTESFTGPFDQVMAFFFYLPNLLVVELIHRSAGLPYFTSSLARGVVNLTLLLAIAIVLLGTYAFLTMFWGPAIWAVMN